MHLLNLLGNRHIFLSVFLISIYRFSLDYIYKNILCQAYSYWNFVDNLSIGSFFTSWVVLYTFTIFLNMYFKTDTVSSQTLWILFLISIVPFTTLISYGVLNNEYIFANFLYWIWLILSLVFLSRCKDVTFVNFYNLSFFNEFRVKVIAVLFLLLMVIICLSFTGFSFTVGIEESNDIRGNLLNNRLPAILDYPYLWSQFITPILFGYFLNTKKYLFAILTGVTMFLSYNINGMKTTLFSIILIAFTYFIPKYKGIKFKNFIIVLFITSTVIAIAENILFKSYFISGIVLMRMLFLPNFISYNYFDFFSNNPLDLYKSSFVKHFGFNSDYDSIPHIIGRLYYNSTMGCNDGLIGDAFCNLGYIGILILPLFTAYVLIKLDKCSTGLPLVVCFACAVVISLRLISSYLITNLLTYGMILLFPFLSGLNNYKKDSSSQ